jgi:hypothetical protein
MEVLVRSYRTRRPNGAELLVDEYWDFVDTSPRFTGTSYAPGMKRLALRSGGEVRQLDETAFQLVSSGELLTDVRVVSTGTSQTVLPELAE